MTAVRQFTYGLILLCACIPTSASAATGMPVADYISTLRQLAASVQNLSGDSKSATDLGRSLPGRWEVQSGDTSFKIDTQTLKADIEQVGKESGGNAKQRLTKEISALIAEAEAYQKPAENYSSSRAALDQILLRSEFHNVHGPTWWDRLKQRLALWVVHALERIFGSSAIATVGKVTVWTIVGVAALVLAIWAFKTIRQGARMETLMPESIPVSAKRWRVWMAEAQAAAGTGNWRNAIHLAYWAGISFLEEGGMWRPDRARTPREYLRLVATNSEYRSALTALTRQFEAVWYGYKEAGPDAFAETLSRLEDLGCRSN
jgi:hypothetical protein